MLIFINYIVSSSVISMAKKPIFDWGTYNGLSALPNAMIIGMRLTEIPPRAFSRKGIDEDYFKKYGESCKGVFTTVTAHGPYYSLTSKDKKVLKDVKKAMSTAIKMAKIAGAEVFNIHIGSALDDRDEAIDIAADMVKSLVKEGKEITITLETTYSPKFLGSIEDIGAIIEKVGSDKVSISLQLDNDFIREFGIYKTGNFTAANREANEKFWYNLFKKALPLSKGYFSLRFSQVIGMYLRKRIFVKKRVPFGRGFPDSRPLAKAIASFVLKEIYEKELPLEVHLIYTGVPETKIRDSIELYSAVLSEIAELL